MRRIGLAIILVLATCIILPLPSPAEFGLSGSLSNQLRVRLLQSDMPDDYDWDYTMLMTALDVQGRAANEEKSARLFFDVDLRHDPTGVFENDLEWRFREGYAGYYSPYVNFEMGKRVFAWGMADEYNPTDLINPEDYRWFMTFDRAERKIGVYNACLTLAYQNFYWQTVAVPYFEPAILAAEDSDWLPWELEGFYSITNSFPDYVDLQVERPDVEVQNTELASRIHGLAGPVEFEAVYFNGYDQLPTFDVKIDPDPDLLLSGGKPLQIFQQYQRYQAAGGSVAFSVSSFSFRGEGAYYTPRYWMYEIDPALLSTDSLLGSLNSLLGLTDHVWRVRKPSWSAVGGFDWRQGTDLYLNLQYVHTQIIDREPEMIDQANEGLVTAKIQTTWLDQELEAGANGAYNVWHHDWYAKPYVRYKFTPELSGELGVQLFGGEPKSRFGDMDDNDFAYTQIKYLF